MKKVINLGGLGVEGRQNELIEVALTYEFDAVEVDMADLLGRNKMMGRDFALQFLKSAGTKVGSFRLPMDFGAEETRYQSQLADLKTICELANALECEVCYAVVEDSSKELAMQENFDRHQKRINEAAIILAGNGIKLGLTVTPQSQRVERAFKFINTAAELLTLVRLVGSPNVGVSFNALTWVQSEGTLEQFAKLTQAQITEVRLADYKDEIPVLPGESEDSFSLAIAKQLKAIGFDGLISVVGNPRILGKSSRDIVMPILTARLNEFVQMIQGTRDELSNLMAPCDSEETDELVGT